MDFKLLFSWLAESVAEAVAPHRCAACDAGCSPRTLFCSMCASSAEARALAPLSDGAIVAPLVYGGSVAEAITRFKFAGRSDLADPLGRYMAGVLRELPWYPGTTIVPVPLHPDRLRERGYNQAALLGRRLAHGLAMDIVPRHLERLRPTRPQTTLGRAERYLNVEGAFALRRRAPRLGPVLVVDDVCTTGATLKACMAQVRRHAEGPVVGVTLAAALGWEEPTFVPGPRDAFRRTSC